MKANSKPVAPKSPDLAKVMDAVSAINQLESLRAVYAFADSVGKARIANLQNRILEQIEK